MVHERWLHAVTRHTGCEMGVDGELEGGGNEGAQACSQDLPPPAGSRAWHSCTQGAAPAEPSPKGPGGSSPVNSGTDTVGNEPTLSPKRGWPPTAESISLLPCHPSPPAYPRNSPTSPAQTP